MAFEKLKNIKLTKKEPSIPLGGAPFIDLMPQSHKDIVSIRRTRKSWTYGFIVVVIVCALVSAGLWAFNIQAKSQLDSEVSTQEQLDIKISNYAEVNQALESQKEAVKLLNQAAGSEIDWAKLIKNIEETLPGGTEVSALSVTTGGTADDEVSSAIVMDLSSSTTLGYSDSLKSIEGLAGVTSVEIGGLSTSGEDNYTYKMAFTYDNSILTEQYGLGE